tara:strand:- start:12512 stop:12712 length:201 start_codon:yes stop_codon:yes gene_type:complete
VKPSTKLKDNDFYREAALTQAAGASWYDPFFQARVRRPRTACIKAFDRSRTAQQKAARRRLLSKTD